MICFLDLDGVLVDFVGGAFALHGRSLPRRAVQWDFDKQLGIPAADFWAPMGQAFWAGLDWTPEGRLLLGGIEGLFGENVVLLTSPCQTVGAVEGKVDWIRQYLPRYSRRFFVGPAKHTIAGPGKVLVDDHEGNVTPFVAHGGNAVLVPRPWNRRASETNDNGCFDVDAVLRELAGRNQP